MTQHMSKHEGKSNDLPPVQKRIILYLAKSDAQTIYGTNSGLNGHYKSSHTAFKALEAKGLIKKIDMKLYLNRQYPRYWLTQAGVFFALTEGADTDKLLRRTIATYPNDKTLQCALEISPLVGLEGFRIARSAIMDKGKLDDSDTTRIMLAGAQGDASIEDFKQLIKILRKYPNSYEKTKNQIGQFKTLLTKLESLIHREKE